MATSGDEGANILKVKKLSTKDSMAALEARLEGMMEHVEERFTRLEEALVGPGMPTSHVEKFFSHFSKLTARVDELVVRVEELEEKVDSFEERVNSSLSEVVRDSPTERKALEARVASLEVELELCKKAIIAGNGGNVAPTRKKVRAPEPKSYDGARDAREIDNFIWNMERYFENVDIVDEDEKVQTATMYLKDTAMLWWRRRYADMEKGLCKIETWAELKRELKKHFYPVNVEFQAYRKLRKLKHVGTLRDYVKEYSALLLEIPDMADKEAMYGFLDGLQTWAARELQSKGVKDLATALAEAEKLDDFKTLGKPKGKGGRQSPPTTDDERSDGESPKRRERRKDGQRTGSPKKRHDGKGRLECFLCNGPHLVRNCPKKTLSAMKKKAAKGSDSESTSDREAQLGSIQLLGSVSKKNEKMQEPRSIQKKDVLYAEVKVNGMTSHALVDTGATHNFVSIEEAKRLGLKMKEDKGWSKPVNAEAKPIQGLVRSADMAIGTWTGQVELSVIEMDDHPMILGMDFMRKNNVMPVPHTATMLLLAGDRPCEVPLVARSQLLKDKQKALAAMQQGEQYAQGKGEVASTSSNSGYRSYRDVVARYASA
ncbi:hypothetical protein CsSME_00037971 [Camellia sinensis var. sinensis]